MDIQHNDQSHLYVETVSYEQSRKYKELHCWGTNESIFLDAIKGVLDDDSFKIMSTTASEARRVAVALLEWCKADENKQKLGIFLKTLFEALQKPLISSSKKSCNREILWRDYFLERSSE